MVDTLTRFFGGDTNIASITEKSIRRFLELRSQSATASTIVLELNVLKRILDLAVDNRVIDDNPSKRIKPPRATPPKPHPLSPTELKLILEASPEWLRPIIELSLTAGLSQQQIVRLRWGDLTTEGGENYLRVKGHRFRRILLSHAAMDTLSSVRPPNPGDQEPIFKGRSVSVINIGAAFRKTCKAVKTKHSFRDLRVTAATRLIDHGIGLETVAQYLGHKSLRMTERYLQPSRVELPRALSKIDDLLK